jgi:hypothetical protein
MACKGRYKIERTSVNSFRFVYNENYQRRSLAPIRYAARAATTLQISTNISKAFCGAVKRPTRQALADK